MLICCGEMVSPTVIGPAVRFHAPMNAAAGTTIGGIGGAIRAIGIGSGVNGPGIGGPGGPYTAAAIICCAIAGGRQTPGGMGHGIPGGYAAGGGTMLASYRSNAMPGTGHGGPFSSRGWGYIGGDGM